MSHTENTKASWGKGHQVAHHYHHHLLHEVLELETISTGSMSALAEWSVVTCDYACHAADWSCECALLRT